QNQREIGAFSNRAKYGSASPRVVADGSSVPKGGGRDHVGKPYRVAGRWYTPRDNPGYSATGPASWYGDAFHGRKTANGEVYDKHAYSAAHPTMPLPSYARVTNVRNGRSIVVRVNDRGPFHGGRIIDLSERVAYALEFKHLGTAQVKVDYLRRANTRGSDDRMLVSTLRTDGAPANLPGETAPSLQPRETIMVAEAAPAPRATPIPRTPAPIPAFSPAPQVAAVAAPAIVASASAAPTLVAEARPIARTVPLPPDRPFELDSIPGGGTPMARVNNGQAGAGQGNAQAAQPQRVAAVYFAPAEGFAARFGGRDPMARIKTGAFADIRHQPVAAPARSRN
ncbi:MAG: septal ring lytic transglycosylase RlpA family protein, partial [Beijerinckiaceae bacterium]